VLPVQYTGNDKRKASESPITEMLRGSSKGKATSSQHGSMGQTKWRRGLSILEKYEICRKRTESKEYEKMSLEEFAQLFPGMSLRNDLI